MAQSNTIRWLHLSDFHVGKDEYGQTNLFRYIMEEVRKKVKGGFIPDMVFITGDIANKGIASEYKIFTDQFLRSLLAELAPAKDINERIFLIPGNHDVDRTKAKVAWRYDVLTVSPNFFDSTTEGVDERNPILPRFAAFSNAGMHNLAAIKGPWLSSAKGTYTKIFELHAHTIGVLGLNTAWLSGSDHDRHQMTAGRYLLEDGLRTLERCNVKFVLGHHPIDWYFDDEVDTIRSLFGRYNVIYLHGHLHKTGGRLEDGGGYPFLPIQAGAAFQARESEEWVNQILWGELQYDKGLTLKLNDRTLEILKRYQAKSKQLRVQSTTPAVALQRLRLGVIAAWQRREYELPEWVKKGEDLSFITLARLLEIER